MQSNAGSRKIVHSVIDLANSLGLPVIAEGIEDRKVMQEIVKRGGELGQGFYLGKAMPADEADALVRRGTAQRMRG
jgi:EAL domain-containing protein (putative c-di-GMP-specific phosphodiesterase class I)